LPPHSAERLGLSGSDLSPLFLRLSLRKKSLRGTQRKAIGIPHCAAASRNQSLLAAAVQYALGLFVQSLRRQHLDPGYGMNLQPAMVPVEHMYARYLNPIILVRYGDVLTKAATSGKCGTVRLSTLFLFDLAYARRFKY
jgi:hypothetical protein